MKGIGNLKLEELTMAEVSACDVARHEEHLKKLTQLEEAASDHERRIGSLEDNHRILTELVSSVKVMANEQINMGRTLNAACARLDTLEARPAKRLDLIGTVLITAALSGVVGYMLANIFK